VHGKLTLRWLLAADIDHGNRLGAAMGHSPALPVPEKYTPLILCKSRELKRQGFAFVQMELVVPGRQSHRRTHIADSAFGYAHRAERVFRSRSEILAHLPTILPTPSVVFIHHLRVFN